jgi:hypothetical protein
MVRSGLGFDSVSGLLGPLATRLLVARACEVDNRRRDRLLGDGLGRPPRRGLYVRSVNGRTSSWFRSAHVRHEAHIEAGGVAKDVLLVETDDMNDQIDAAYRAKYHRYAESIVSSIISPEARAATLKLVPR